MKKSKKSIMATTMGVVCCLLISMSVFASSGSYCSTYDMTGGVFSRYITPSSKVTVHISPIQGSPDCDMGVIWAKKYWYGWDGPMESTSSVKESDVSFSSSEKRKIWLRNFSGVRWTGNVSFSWK